MLLRKNVVQDKVLSRGEGRYSERLEDIRVLKLEIKRLRQEETVLARNSQTMDEMK